MLRLRNTPMIWNFLVVFTTVIGLFILTINLIPHQVMKTWVDSLAPDGSLESFTPAIFSTIKRIFFPIGLLSILLAIWLFRSRKGASRIISTFLVSQQAFTASRSAEFRHLLEALREAVADARYGFALFGITALGIANRAVLLSRQVSHDEAYTFMAFVSMGLRQVITDYHLPNNHVFHSLLVLISTEIFGIQPWAIRLPALLAGVLLIPAAYLVACRFYDKQTALVSSGWVAAIPALISYAANARGYSIIALFSLLLVASGAYLKEKRSLVGWIAFILISAFGFYTVPIMLYPFGLVMTWMFLSAVFKQVGPDYLEAPFSRLVVRTLIPVGIAVIALVSLLYTPIFLNSGIRSVVGNGFVAPMEWWEFRESIPVRVANTWREWLSGVPEILWALIVIGLIASVSAAITRRPIRVPLAVAALLWIGSALVIQRVAPWPRVWIFLLPLVLISSAAGLMVLARVVGSRLRGGNFLTGAVFLVALLVPLVSSGVNTVHVYRESRGERGNIEELAKFLQDYMGPQDVILVTAPDAVTLRYYLRQYKIEGDQVFYRDHLEYRNAYAIVNQRYNQTLGTVMENRSSTAKIDTKASRIIYQKGKILVYEIELSSDPAD